MSKRTPKSEKPAVPVDQSAEAATARAICAQHGNKPDELLEILHDVQASLGFVPEAVLPVIAHALNRSRAEVHGVVTFYHDYRREKPGQHVVKICRAESCQAMNANALCDHAEKSLGAAMGETSKDGRFTLEPVYCLGNCALSPAVMIDGQLHGRVSPKRLDVLVSNLAAKNLASKNLAARKPS